MSAILELASHAPYKAAIASEQYEGYRYDLVRGRDDEKRAAPRMPKNLHLLWQIISDEKLELNRPIAVEVSFLGEGFSVSSGEFDIEGVGATKEEAISDFMDFFAGDYGSLLGASDRLTPQAQKLLDLYKAAIKH